MQTADEDSLRTLYDGLNDGKVLELAAKRKDLTETAQRVLRVELKKSGITDSQVSQFAQHLKALEMADRSVPIATQVNGCGTALFGRRYENPDGSYVVTRWATIFWIPVVPLKDMKSRGDPRHPFIKKRTSKDTTNPRKGRPWFERNVAELKVAAEKLPADASAGRVSWHEESSCAALHIKE
jgi:hypothetical protein